MFKSGSILSEFRNELTHQLATNYNTEETYYTPLVIVGLLISPATHPSGAQSRARRCKDVVSLNNTSVLFSGAGLPGSTLPGGVRGIRLLEKVVRWGLDMGMVRGW
jgi:hypothetical protein